MLLARIAGKTTTRPDHRFGGETTTWDKMEPSETTGASESITVEEALASRGARPRAGAGTRTPDLRITSALLYQLSYPGGLPLDCKGWLHQPIAPLDQPQKHRLEHERRARVAAESKLRL